MIGPVHTRYLVRQHGFSYAMVLAAVVILGIVAEAAHVTTWRMLKADRETELLFRGEAYRRAIKSYYEAGGMPGGFPRSLDDLLKDSRFASKHHIRELYADPMSQEDKPEWALIRAPDGGISGVASASKDEPLKQANFPAGLEKFAGAKSYSEWIFEYVPPLPPVRVPSPPNSQQPAAPPVFRTN